MNEYPELREAVPGWAVAEWAMSAKGRAFAARAELRQELREINRRSDLDIMRAVMVVQS